MAYPVAGRILLVVVMTKPKMSVAEALEVAIQWLRIAGTYRKDYQQEREAASVLRRLPAFVEAAMAFFAERARYMADQSATPADVEKYWPEMLKALDTADAAFRAMKEQTDGE